MIKRNNKNEQRKTDIHKITSALHILIQILNSLTCFTQKKNIRHFPQLEQNESQIDLNWLRSNRSKAWFLETEKVQSSQTFSFFPSLSLSKIMIFIVRLILRNKLCTWPKHHNSHGILILTGGHFDKKKDRHYRRQATNLVFRIILQ